MPENNDLKTELTKDLNLHIKVDTGNTVPSYMYDRIDRSHRVLYRRYKALFNIAKVFTKMDTKTLEETIDKEMQNNG